MQQSSEWLKKESINNYISQDQQLYDINATRLIPKNHHEYGTEGDTIALKTRFDDQAALGKFLFDKLNDIYNEEGVIDELPQTQQYSEELSGFCADLLKSLALRDKYMKVSNQRNVDNPINYSDWVNYPSAPVKGWHYADEYGKSSYYFDVNEEPRYSGQRFELDDYIETVLKTQLRGQYSHDVIEHGRNGYAIQGFEHSVKPSFKEFFQDLSHIINCSTSKIGSLLAAKRIDFLKAKFDSYTLLNENKELYLTKLNPHRDFYNVRKIDNNVTVAMCMSKTHLLYVINEKIKSEPKRVVFDEDGVRLTLEELFAPYFADDSSRRFNIDDLFEFGLIDRNFSNDTSEFVVDASASYDHIIKSEALLRIDKTFLRVDNAINGEYLNEIMKYVLNDYEKSKYQFGEMGINFNLMSNYQRFGYRSKWESISSWVVDNKLVSHNVKWNIRIPRNYSVLRKANKVKNFQEFIDLIFKALFEVSVNPLKDPKLHFFLTKVSTFDLLSAGDYNDESLFDITNLVPPKKWSNSRNPPYCYYLYYISTNLSNLNEYRKSRKFNTLPLRPHSASVSSKSGHGIITESLSANFLLAKNIINGEKLANYPVLEYMYYLKQIGITMSPLTWNKRVQLLNDDDRNIESSKENSLYETHPMIDFFHKGLRVSLSTNKPLFASLTKEPLIEEYSVAASIHKLNGVDLCELSRNSVLNSEFNGELKRHWIGIKYKDDALIDHEDSDEFAIQRGNVPQMRLDYRRDTLMLEHEFIEDMVFDGVPH